MRQRRQLLRDLCRKYGDDVAEVIAYGEQAAGRLAELEGYEVRAAAIDAERAAARRRRASAAAATVGRARRAAAPLLGEAVTARLRELAMPHATVTVDRSATTPATTSSSCSPPTPVRRRCR